VSLSGSVEDLPLLEILQVVSYCQKTGHLTVRSSAGEATVVFDSGRVVAGYSWDVPTLPAGEPAPGPARDRLVRDRIALILEKLVRWRDGEFAFHLSPEVPIALGGRDLTGEMLPGGINPEELMLDLAKNLDEDRRDAAATLEASFAAPLAEDRLGLEDLLLEELALDEPAAEVSPAAEPPADGPAVLLVDDEPEVRRIVGERLRAAGFAVLLAHDLPAARAAMERLAAQQRPFRLIADVGLPSEAGTSFQGGLDVARYATGLASPPRVLLISETIDEKLRGHAKRAGASLLAFKPGLSKLDPLQYEADLRAFGDKLARDLLPRLEGRRPAGRPVPLRLAPLRLTPLRLAPQPVALRPRDDAAGIREAALAAGLAELSGHPDPDVVAFVLLRAARAFFPRVVLFLVRDERLRGLSGVGPVANGASLDLVARELSVPLGPASPFAEAVAFGRAWSGPLPVHGPLAAMVDRLGRLGAVSGAVLPVRAQHETIAVVYGDAPGGAALPELAPLVAFTEQAGRALDTALLERRAPTELAC
jgi:CheY-like chemotaxis protein